ncbi:MAG: hypothetical protein QM817_17100 [Archangium sp.]
MKYTVRTKDGELTFESRAHLNEAARTGLVDADDEVKREDESAWVKASKLPGLIVEAKKPSALANPFVRWVLLACAGSIAAFVLIYKGRQRGELELQAAGVGIVILVAVILIRITTNAQRRR